MMRLMGVAAMLEPMPAVSNTDTTIYVGVYIYIYHDILIYIFVVVLGESSTERREGRERVAFKTKSEVEILEDGFKWRKYGKKMVKNSPNPRYYLL